uniref:BY PROTMAP: gi/472581916/gb/EMS19624.1/ programmed cell death protein-like protein [Rhodosporidium toruloides NP11] n=1 Tax=Rhodotorula toruloides TaxID=5286 RepID=A0A0K3C7S5_RHOTO
MPPPQASYLSRTSDKGYDPATLSDDESDSDSGSVTSRSTWTSSAAPGDETAILGLVDGLIPEDRLDEELADWKISRVGGLPCRRKEGAVRVWRANGVWREGRVEEERREREEREREERRERAKNLDLGGLVFASSSSGATPANSANPFNPFAPPTSAASSNPFVLPTSSSTASATASTATATAPASNPFASTSNPFAAPAPPTPAVPVACPSTASPLAQTTSSWAFSSNSTHPSYPAQYLTTMYEPPSSSSSSSKAKAKGKGKERELAKAMELGLRLDADDEGMDFDDEEQDGPRRAGKGSGGRVKKGAPVSAGDKRKTGTTTGGGGEWQKEGYEVQKVKGVDEVFLRFQERVAREGRQVVRLSRPLLPLPSPPCPSCRSPSTFEAQLMPHLVSLCPDQDWATVWVVSCAAECAGGIEGEGEEEERWREERALVEWEEEAV